MIWLFRSGPLEQRLELLSLRVRLLHDGNLALFFPENKSLIQENRRGDEKGRCDDDRAYALCVCCELRHCAGGGRWREGGRKKELLEFASFFSPFRSAKSDCDSATRSLASASSDDPTA